MQSIFITFGLIGLITCIKLISSSINGVSFIGYLLIYLYESYLPLLLLQRNHLNPANYGLHMYGLLDYLMKRAHNFHRQLFWRDIKQALWLSLFTFPLYALVFYVAPGLLGSTFQHGANLSLSLIPQLLFFFLNDLISTALPEEFFFRGYLQHSLLKRWPKVKFIGPLPIGMAIVVTNLLFALAHFGGEWNAARLLTFFPGLLFSALTYRSGSILGAVFYHSLCNTLSNMFYTVYMQ